jgi:hypothetical protein
MARLRGSILMVREEKECPQPEVASLNMGSMNFRLFPMLKRFKQFKNDWEPANPTISSSVITSKTYAMPWRH